MMDGERHAHIRQVARLLCLDGLRHYQSPAWRELPEDPLLMEALASEVAFFRRPKQYRKRRWPQPAWRPDVEFYGDGRDDLWMSGED